MKRVTHIAFAVIVLAASALAQRPGLVAGGGGSRTGFGNVVFPGTGHAPAPGAVFRSPFSITDPGFAQRLGNTVSGFPQAGARHQRQRSVVVVPYAYPVAVGGYGYGYPVEQATPNVTIINAPPQVPQVVINQNYIPESASPVIREYPEGASASPGVTVYQAPSRYSPDPAAGSAPEENRSYLIAFKDHSIYSALAYWVQGDTLHYVTPQGVHNQASLDLIDREFTEQLNRERNAVVRLPGK
jgi:hypothetical protein